MLKCMKFCSLPILTYQANTCETAFKMFLLMARSDCTEGGPGPGRGPGTGKMGYYYILCCTVHTALGRGRGPGTGNGTMGCGPIFPLFPYLICVPVMLSNLIQLLCPRCNVNSNSPLPFPVPFPLPCSLNEPLFPLFTVAKWLMESMAFIVTDSFLRKN